MKIATYFDPVMTDSDLQCGKPRPAAIVEHF